MKTTIEPTQDQPDHITTHCQVVSVDETHVEKDGETFPYLRLNLLPANQVLRDLRERDGGIFSCDLPAANLTSNSLIAKCLARSGINAVGDVDLSAIFNGSVMEVQFHRIERFSPNTGETRNFWQIDRGTLKIVPAGTVAGQQPLAG